MMNSKLSNFRNQFPKGNWKLPQAGNLIDLSCSIPEFSPSDRLIKLVNQYMKRGYNQFAPSIGIVPLREQIAKKVEALYGYSYDPELDITITAGATQAIYTAITALVKEGDEVIVFEPAYESYLPAIEVNGGTPVFVQLKDPDFHIDWNEVQKVVSTKTRMIIINSPHYPTGAVLSTKDMLKLQKIIRGTNIIVLSDEVNEHIVFDDNVHESMASYPGLAQRSLIVGSFGKTYHVTGWRIGFCLGPNSLMKEFRKIHQCLIHSVNAPIQYALADFITDKEEYTKLGALYQSKRDYFQDLLKETRFGVLPVMSGYFQLVNYSNISQEQDVDFALRLLSEFGIASIPLSLFYHETHLNKFLRFCFAQDEQILKRAVEILRKL